MDDMQLKSLVEAQKDWIIGMRRKLHQIPEDGFKDFETQQTIMDALDEIGYNGVYNMELNLAFYGEELLVDTAQFAVKVLRRFLNTRDSHKED